jgi:Cu+-exporting ATPase
MQMSTKTQISITGITCSHCAKSIEQHLKEIGLNDAQVNFATKSATFSSSPQLSTEEIIKNLKNIGYGASLDDGSKPNVFSFFSELNFITFLCCLLALPLVTHGFFFAHLFHNPLVQLGLTLPIMLTGGIHFTRSAIISLKLGSPNMDVLIAIGTWSAFIYSITGTVLNLGPDYLFYETSASIIAIVLLGNLIEERALLKTERSVSELQQLQPEKVKIKNSDESESIIASSDLKLNDHIILSPGDRVPCDGKIIEGSAELDLSFLSGESVPKNIQAGDRISSGSLVIGGYCLVLAEQIGEDSSLVRIIKNIQEARAAKPNLEKMADRLVSYFVPVVLVIAALTFLLNLIIGVGFGESLLRAIAVLVVSCPCALGLATPTAVTVALGLAARMGILVRRATLFEAIPKLNHFIFDKTGTLTDGQFQVIDFTTDGIEENQAKSIILALESSSNHPIAKSLKDYCSQSSLEQIKLVDQNEQRGFGVLAKSISGDTYELSSREIALPYNLGLRRNDQVVAKIRLQDQLRPEAFEVISNLTKLKITTEILSGDRLDKTSKCAQILGISKYSAGLKPQDKTNLVAKAASVSQVAFVGDGINDSAALARSQVGITFADSSDLARHSADVVIVSGGLEKILDLIDLSKKTTENIKQNLFWAFIYNILMIPIATLGFLSPLHAAFSMVLSDFIIVANSLRLKLWKPRKR